MNAPSTRRTYRLAPPDHTGFVFGLGIAQLALLAAGIVLGTLAMMAGHVPAGLSIVVLDGIVCVGRLHGTPLIELLPYAARFVRQRISGDTQWSAPLTVVGGGNSSRLPRALDGLSVMIVDPDGAPAAARQVLITQDELAGVLATTLRVSGQSMVLLESDEHDVMLAGWGSALQALIAERPNVCQIRWSEWLAPLGLDEHRRWITRNRSDEPAADIVAIYDDMIRAVETTTYRHEVLVTVSMASTGPDTVGLLLREARLLAQRLEAAGLSASALSPDAWVRAMRLRLDPTGPLWRSDRGLHQVADDLSFESIVPTSTQSDWTQWQTDACLHRSLYVVEWPRTDVPATWLGELLRFQGCVRTITVGFEPVPRSRSHRGVVRDAAKIASDAEHRAERGFRVGAAHRRAAQAVDEREDELVAGYGEFTYAGVVTLSAPSVADLDDATEQIRQLAASIGVELKPLHGRHDVAACVALPIARGFTRGRR